MRIATHKSWSTAVVATLTICCLLIACSVASTYCDGNYYILLGQSTRYVQATENAVPQPGTYFEYNVTTDSFGFTNGTYYLTPPREWVSMRVRIECVGREGTRALYRIAYANDDNGSVLYLPHNPLNLTREDNHSSSSGGIHHLPQAPINVTIWEDHSFELQCGDGLALRGLSPLFWDLDWGINQEVIVEQAGNRSVMGSRVQLHAPWRTSTPMGSQEILLVEADGSSYLGDSMGMYYEFDSDTGLLLAIRMYPCSYMLLVPAGIDSISGNIELLDTNFDLGPPFQTGLGPADIQALLAISVMAIFFGGGLLAHIRRRSRARQPVEESRREPGAGEKIPGAGSQEC